MPGEGGVYHLTRAGLAATSADLKVSAAHADPTLRIGPIPPDVDRRSPFRVDDLITSVPIQKAHHTKGVADGTGLPRPRGGTSLGVNELIGRKPGLPESDRMCDRAAVLPITVHQTSVSPYVINV